MPEQKDINTEKYDPITNLVKATGVVRFVKPGKESDRVSIRVRRNDYEKKHARDGKDYDDIAFYFFHADNTNLEQILLGDNVRVSGHVAAPRKVRPDGSVYWSQSFIGDYIAMTQEPESDKDRNSKNHCYVFLSGKIENIAALGYNLATIRVNARNRGFNNHITVIARRADIERFHVGDVVDITAGIRTKKQISTRKRPDGSESQYIRMHYSLSVKTIRKTTENIYRKETLKENTVPTTQDAKENRD